VKNVWIYGLPMPNSAEYNLLSDTNTKRTVTGRVVLQRNFYNIGTITFVWNDRLDVEIHEILTDTAVEERRSYAIEELIRNCSSVQIYGDDPATGASGIKLSYGVVEDGQITMHPGWPPRFSAQVTVRLYPELPST
jgi:hypothetical protein